MGIGVLSAVIKSKWRMPCPSILLSWEPDEDRGFECSNEVKMENALPLYLIIMGNLIRIGVLSAVMKSKWRVPFHSILFSCGTPWRSGF